MTDELFNYLNRRYGVQLAARFAKLDEEYNELREAWAAYLADPTVARHCEMVDELADVNILVYHIAGLLSYTQRDLLALAEEKIRRREKEPNYKRK